MTENNIYAAPTSDLSPDRSFPSTRRRTIDEAIEERYDFSVSDTISESFGAISGLKMPVFLASLLLFAISFVVGIIIAFLPETAGAGVEFGLNVIISALGGGYYVYTLNHLRGRGELTIESFFSVSTILSTLILIEFIVWVLGIIGIMLLILPGIYILVALSFASVIAVDNPELGTVKSIAASFKLVNKQWFKVFLLELLLWIIVLISAIPFGIGLIWTIPMYLLAKTIVYRKMIAEA